MSKGIPKDPDAAQRKRRIWQHNSFLGHAKMMQHQCTSIIQSVTATPEAKSIASDIYVRAQALTGALAKRIDHD